MLNGNSVKNDAVCVICTLSLRACAEFPRHEDDPVIKRRIRPNKDGELPFWVRLDNNDYEGDTHSHSSQNEHLVA